MAKGHIHSATFVAGDWRLGQVAVEDYYAESMEEGMDLVSVQEYKRALTKNKYEPILICRDFVIDGTHRIIAAHHLNLKTIKAYICIV